MDVPRITLKLFLAQTIAAVFELEGSLWNTARLLISNPGIAIREYIEGRRKHMFNAGKLLLIVGAISAIVVSQFQSVTEITERHFPKFIEQLGFDSQGYFMHGQENITLVNVLTIPVFAFFTWSLFRKGYNYAENLVLNTYVTSVQLALYSVLAPFLALLPFAHDGIIAIYSIIILVYNVWVVLTFFEQINWLGVIKMVGVLVLSFVFQFALNYPVYVLLQSMK
jgi:hypothetical protein